MVEGEKRQRALEDHEGNYEVKGRGTKFGNRKLLCGKGGKY